MANIEPLRNYRYPTSITPPRSPSTREQTPGSFSTPKFQLHYDDFDEFQLNRPISARLRKYSGPKVARNSIPSIATDGAHHLNNTAFSPRSPSSRSLHTYDGAGEDDIYLEELLKQKIPADETVNELFRNYHHEIDDHDHNVISRSMSLPILKKQYHNIEVSTSNHVSRKNSLISNCQHSDDAASLNEYAAAYQQSASNDENEDAAHNYTEKNDCKRHHHRRGSVAIKFKGPEVVSCDAEIPGFQKSLNSYEMKTTKY